MLRELFDDQRRYLNHFFDRIDVDRTDKILRKLLDCKGIVLFSGVGKSGHIAHKIAATLSSTGTRSFFLSPAQALHGDVGFVTQDDIFILLSKSGETQELLDLLPHIKKKGAFTIGCISEPNSRLFSACDLSILLPVVKELCPYDLAPTTSTAVQLIFCDCLAIALMQAKGFSQGDFALNHPAGFLGRRITLKVSDLMLKNEQLPLCRPDQKLIDVLCELSGKRCGCLLITDADLKLIGIFTDGDMRRSIETLGPEALQKPMFELMTEKPKTIEKDLLAFDAMRHMEENRSRPVTVLPVIQQEKVIGLLRMHDVLQAGLH